MVMGGGMVVFFFIVEVWKWIIGINIIEGYGLFEILFVVMVNLLVLEEFSGIIGILLLLIEVVILDDDGKEVVLGE